MSMRRGKRRHEPETPKPCSNNRCPKALSGSSPECTLNISERCVKSGWTSRWYHVTTNEHYCNECFEHAYRNPIAMGAYITWQKQWNADSRFDSTMKLFFAEQIMPFWLRCRDCGTWRRVDCIDLPTTASVAKNNTEWSAIVNDDMTIKDFVCGQFPAGGDKKPDTCSTPEDKCVEDAQGVFWLADLGFMPFLLSSPAMDMLSAYYPDGVGVSPVGVWKWKGKAAAIAAVEAAAAAAAASAAAAAAATAGSPTISSPSVTEVKMETGNDAAGSQASGNAAAVPSAAVQTPGAAQGTLKKRTSLLPSYKSSNVMRPLRRHQLGKHGGPGRSKAKQSNDDDGDSSDDEELNRKFGYFQPFHRPGRECKARSFRPDTMEPEECLYFPEFAVLKNPTLYLGLRNLILALWSKDCTVPLDVDGIMHHVLLRGMVRIRCRLEVGRILAFLIRRAFVNVGFVESVAPSLPQVGIANRPKQPPYPRWTSPTGAPPSVLVVGAGPAGLSAAYHLQQMGITAKVLEARDRTGGRVCDDRALGACVGRGAQIVNGCVNNPISTMCKQAGIPMRRLTGQCTLIDERGQRAASSQDEHAEQFFNNLLDLVGDWRQQQLAEEERQASAAATQAASTKAAASRPAAKRSRQRSSAGSRRGSTDDRGGGRSGGSSAAATPTKCPSVGSASGSTSATGAAVSLHSLMATPPPSLPSPSSSCPPAPSSATGSQTSAGDTRTAEVRAGGDAVVAAMPGTSASPRLPAATPPPSQAGSSGAGGLVGSMPTLPIGGVAAAAAAAAAVASPTLSPVAVSVTGARATLQDSRQQHGGRLELKSDSSHGEAPLAEMLEKAKRAFSDMIPNGDLQKDQDRLLDFHYGNLEYSCGATLDQVSAMYWDQNDHFPQFLGDHTVMVDGFSPVLQRLAEKLDIQLDTAVSAIDYTEEVAKVTTAGGDVLTADFVIVTAPLSLLKRGVISFEPPLPEWKQEAIQQLGAGLIEKVALRFPTRFWSSKVNGGDFFGHIPTGSEVRGMCGVFYDLSARTEDNQEGVLMTIVSGKSLDVKNRTSDADLAASVVSLLRAMFPEESVPEPVDYFVSNWGNDPWAGMSYSYVAAGGSGLDYDRLAQPVLNRLLFAGEATNRQHPQTVTGAFLSGVREATRVADMAL